MGNYSQCVFTYNSRLKELRNGLCVLKKIWGERALNIPFECFCRHFGLVRLRKPGASKNSGLGEWWRERQTNFPAPPVCHTAPPLPSASLLESKMAALSIANHTRLSCKKSLLCRLSETVSGAELSRLAGVCLRLTLRLPEEINTLLLLAIPIHCQSDRW